MITVLDTRVLSGSGGGPDKTLINSPPFLVPHGYRMLCGYLHDPADPGFGVLSQRARVAGTELISIPDRGPLDLGIIRRCLDVIRRENVTVWHGHDYKTNALGLILKRLHPLRLVTTAHGWVHRTRRTPIYYAIDRACLRWYERVICVSEDLVSACRRAGVARSRCVLLENGIDTTVFRRRRTPSEARRALGFDDVPTIGAVGRLSPEKGFDLLIRAADRLIGEGVPLQLVIAGEGPEREHLASLIKRPGIKLLGYRTDLTDLYESMDVYALSSDREGLPNVVLEAMAMGTPVVATAVNGVPKLVGDAGLLVPPRSVDAMADGLRRLLSEGALRTRLAVAGRERVERHYSFADRMAKLADLYDDMHTTRNPDVGMR